MSYCRGRMIGQTEPNRRFSGPRNRETESFVGERVYLFSIEVTSGICLHIYLHVLYRGHYGRGTYEFGLRFKEVGEKYRACSVSRLA